MRLHLRPAYIFNRTRNAAKVTWGVARDNRAVADAFMDPDGLDASVRWPVPSARQARWAALTAAAAVVAASAWFIAQHVRSRPLSVSEDFSKIENSVPTVPSAPSLPAAPKAPAAPGLSKPAPAPESPAPSVASLAAPIIEAPAPLAFPEKGYCLIACKRDRTLYVYKREGKRWDRTAAFPMAIGRKAGDKGDAGDLRTPEGRFWIIELLSGEDKGAPYGPLAFTLNYPRPGDAADGKTGQGIWIHGTEAGKLPTWTHGCLSLANEDVLALSAYADVGIPVVVLPDSLSPDPASQVDLAGMEREYPSIMAARLPRSKADSAARGAILKRAAAYVNREAQTFPELGLQALSAKDKQAILARVEKWRSDWMRRSIDEYAANYDQDFRDRMGRDRNSFLERKRKIFESKSKIEMEIREPRIESEGYARARVSFRQDYLADGPQGVQRSSELKSLRLEDGPAGWLIITE